MPTLRIITTALEREAYHRFRHAVYANSRQRGFLAGPQGTDLDAYDSSALHLGWFDGEELIGCVRLLRPIMSQHPLHLFKYMAEPQLDRAGELVNELKQQGIQPCEVSRLCLLPQHRTPGTIRSFVLAIIATAHRYGIDHCLFTCDRPHKAFWSRLGFEVVEGFDGYERGGTVRPGCLMRGSYTALLNRNRAELQRLGWSLLTPMASAA